MVDQILLNLPEENLNLFAEKGPIENIIPLPVRVENNQTIGYFISPDGATPQKSLLRVRWTLPEGVNRDQIILDGLEFTEEKPPRLVSKRDGFLTTMENKMRVSRVYEIHKNINRHTGNIKTEFSVLIHGGVSEGIEILSGGDVEIRGIVEEATIRAKGKIVAKAGIAGGDIGKLIAGEDIFCQFVQQAQLEAFGNILVDGSIFNSNVLCGKKVTIRKKGLLVGGKTMARNGIEAEMVGTEGAIATKVEIGGNPFRQIQIEQIKNEIHNLNSDMETSAAGIKHFENQLMGMVKFLPSNPVASLFSAAESVQSEGRELSEEKLFQLNKFGSGIMRLMRVKGEIELLEKELTKVKEDETLTSKAKLRVKRTVHPGVIITIHGITLKVLHEYNGVAFYYNPEKDKIIAGRL